MAATTAPVNTIDGAHCTNGSSNNNALDLDSIAPMVNAGFRAVLAEASKLGVLDPPHGRTPMPDPKKITDEDPFTSDGGGRDGGSESEKAQGTYAATTQASAGPPPSPGGTRNDNGNNDDGDDYNNNDDDDDDDSDEKLLEYKFDYGFNSLVFLGEYLRRNNPVAIRARDEQHDANLEYLRQRAARCLGREAVFVELNELVVQRRSGIVHGPIVGEVSDCGGMMWARAFRPGQLTVELSRHEDFRTICRQEVAKVDESTGCSAVVEFDDLDPNAVWYHRTYLHNPRQGFDDPSATFSLKGKFWTLPERDQDDGGAFRFAALSLHGLGDRITAAERRDEIEAACSAILAGDAKLCLALGEPSAHAVGTAGSSVAAESFRDLQETAVRTPALARLLQGHAFLTASGHASKLASKGEREKHQKVANNKRGSSRPEGSLAVGGGARTAGKSKRGSTPQESDRPGSVGDGDTASTSLDWPIRCPEAWGSRPLGPTAEMFIIDARAGAIGDEQLSWVAEAVTESHRTWKVIACGVPVGYPVTASTDPAPGDEETTRQNAAAATIQASLRSRISVSKDPVTHSNTTKESSATCAAAGAAVAKGGESSPPPRGKEGGPTPTTPVGSDAAVIGPGAGGGGGGGGGGALGDGLNVSRATVQMQGMVSQLHTSGCKNVVLITPARSSPHVLSFFSGHETEGKFPVFELGCSGLVPSLRGKSSSSGSSPGPGRMGDTDSIQYPGAATAKPCLELAPELLMPEATSAYGGGVVGVACTVSFGTGREEGDDRGEDAGGDWLSFSVCGASGESISSLRLAAVTQ